MIKYKYSTGTIKILCILGLKNILMPLSIIFSLKVCFNYNKIKKFHIVFNQNRILINTYQPMIYNNYLLYFIPIVIVMNVFKICHVYYNNIIS